MPIDHARRVSFDAVAQAYDRFRPGYPEELYTTLLNNVPVDGRALEIGAGTGRATVVLAKHGLTLTALEPGAALAEITRKALAPFPDAHVVEQRFEDWPLEPEAFDLVAAAQSFHWVEPEIGLTKVAATLKPGGAVGLFWNKTVLDSWEPVQRNVIDAIYNDVFPAHKELQNNGKTLEERLNTRERQIRDSGHFHNVAQHRYRWDKTHSVDDYIALIDTYSENRTLPDDRRAAFYTRMRHAIESTGGKVTLPYLTVLFMAHR